MARCEEMSADPDVLGVAELRTILSAIPEWKATAFALSVIERVSHIYRELYGVISETDVEIFQQSLHTMWTICAKDKILDDAAKDTFELMDESRVKLYREIESESRYSYDRLDAALSVVEALRFVSLGLTQHNVALAASASENIRGFLLTRAANKLGMATLDEHGKRLVAKDMWLARESARQIRDLADIIRCASSRRDCVYMLQKRSRDEKTELLG